MTAFEDTTPFVLALLITFIALVCISIWNNFNSVKVEKEVLKPKTEGPSRTRELLIRFTKFYNDLDAHNNYLYDTQLLPDPKQHIIHALYVGYDESENEEDRKAIKIGLEAITQFQDLIGDETLKPEIDEDTTDYQSTNLENLDISDKQKKYIDFNNKRIKELETHFTHLKIEIDENVMSEEKMDTQDKRNASE
ncbi:MAG: hypothetical protein EVA21_04060 [Alphaproteobacteria bacterium]|nr:MAG: hypothetical protein EVA21_04060 [Alphaproteobacteria bacterium]